MRIEALFIVRPDDGDLPELLTAWDEYSIDENPEGWRLDQQGALDAVGEDDILHKAVVTINVDDVDILSVLRRTGTVHGSVSLW